MTAGSNAKHNELVRINKLVEAYERAHESEHREKGKPLQKAYLYASDPSDRSDYEHMKYIFGQAQVRGVTAALALMREIATGYGIDVR